MTALTLDGLLAHPPPITDPRSLHGRRFGLLSLLASACAAVLSGQTSEVEYAITSVGPEWADAADLLDWWRGHWGIENRVHSG